jgi:hypothetical protein
VAELAAINRPCNQVVADIRADLDARGADVRLSFDLQAARRRLRDPGSCTCPYHRTSRCTCQYLILQVSFPEGPPLTLVAHGYGHMTRILLANDQQPPAEQLVARILHAANAVTAVKGT